VSLKTAFFSMVQLTKLDNTDITNTLIRKGFDLRYHYMTSTTAEGIEFTQFLDRGSRLSLRNEHVDYHALAAHIEKQKVNTMGVEG